MSLYSWVSWIKKKHRVSTQLDDTGVVISTRLKELLQVKDHHPTEATSTDLPNEGDQNQLNRDKFGT